MTLQQTNEKISFLQQLDSKLIFIGLTETDKKKKAQAIKLSRTILKSVVYLMSVKKSLIQQEHQNYSLGNA
jgi:selenocysteine-specific translation elongation factor